jgi:pyruvate formate lyase activating enzyme
MHKTKFVLTDNSIHDYYKMRYFFMNLKGTIFDIKRYALHDGPGIRTTVFLRGCPLHCTWCHNPESHAFGTAPLNGPNGTITIGREITSNEIIKEVIRDIPFYIKSKGGVTFSGGEPLAQPKFLLELLRENKKHNIHCAVDTSGYGDKKLLLDIAEYTDLFLYDLKLINSDAHIKYTGIDTEIIHDNLQFLCNNGATIEIRLPIIPDITDTEENLLSISKFINSLSRPLPLRLLPYHRAAMDKYPRFGLTPPLPDTPEPSASKMKKIINFFKQQNINIQNKITI